jgi:hypothetical protein
MSHTQEIIYLSLIATFNIVLGITGHFVIAKQLTISMQTLPEVLIFLASYSILDRIFPITLRLYVNNDEPFDPYTEIIPRGSEEFRARYKKIYGRTSLIGLIIMFYPIVYMLFHKYFFN